MEGVTAKGLYVLLIKVADRTHCHLSFYVPNERW